MEPISYSLRDVLVRQGIANAKPVGAGKVRGIGAGLREGADRPATVQPEGGYREPMGIKAGERGALHPELRQGEETADLNSGKDRGNVTPAKFTGLRLVSSRCLDTASPTREPRAAVSKHLMLVVSN